LIGVEGIDDADVLRRILSYWVNQNEAFLTEKGITFARFQELTDESATEPKVLSLPQRKAKGRRR
jgi:hypothetical protein